MTIVEGNVPVKVAAMVLGMSETSVKGALLTGALPIGGAWKNAESSHDMFHISPQKLAEYEGYSKEEIIALIEEAKK